MHRASIISGGALSALLLAVPAAAQAPAPGSAPIAWRSAFEGYQPYTEAPVANWREANDTVGRIGGWRAYAREAQEAQGAQEGREASGSIPPTGAAHAPSGAATSGPHAPAAGHRH